MYIICICRYADLYIYIKCIYITCSNNSKSVKKHWLPWHDYHHIFLLKNKTPADLDTNRWGLFVPGKSVRVKIVLIKGIRYKLKKFIFKQEVHRKKINSWQYIKAFGRGIWVTATASPEQRSHTAGQNKKDNWRSNRNTLYCQSTRYSSVLIPMPSTLIIRAYEWRECCKHTEYRQ